MFFKRSYDPEILDDFSIKDDRVDSALLELKVINSLLGGNKISREGIRMLNRNLNAFNILDIGAGASDILLSIKKDINNPVIYSLDRNQRTCRYLKDHSPEIKVICGDVLSLPCHTSFDIVHASLFLHHFTEEQIEKIIISLMNLSSRGIVINDLNRSIFAWLGIKILTILFSNSKAVKYDGPLSVKRGFIRKDWINILRDIAPNRYVIKRKWAFRWLIVIYK
jgi:2-polyprenyl-3-methyl-5-hydroxy-6-metoxy-1,4-benzoquinol methylase